jgi:hypothetical protein
MRKTQDRYARHENRAIIYTSWGEKMQDLHIGTKHQPTWIWSDNELKLGAFDVQLWYIMLNLGMSTLGWVYIRVRLEDLRNLASKLQSTPRWTFFPSSRLKIDFQTRRCVVLCGNHWNLVGTWCHITSFSNTLQDLDPSANSLGSKIVLLPNIIARFHCLFGLGT